LHTFKIQSLLAADNGFACVAKVVLALFIAVFSIVIYCSRHDYILTISLYIISMLFGRRHHLSLKITLLPFENKKCGRVSGKFLRNERQSQGRGWPRNLSLQRQPLVPFRKRFLESSTQSERLYIASICWHPTPRDNQFASGKLFLHATYQALCFM
jgi:hypothetical protein